MSKKRRHTGPYVRFWIPTDSGPVRLTLFESHPIETYYRAATDEGWSSEWTRLDYDADDGTVTYQWATDGVDCDGRYSQGGESIASVDQLTAREPYVHDDHSPDTYEGVRYPQWERADRYQRDYAAEAAGY